MSEDGFCREISFATLNIHGSYDCSPQLLFEYFSAFPQGCVDVLALQECPKSVLAWDFRPGENLWSKLDLWHHHYAGAGYLGNLLLSRYPLAHARTVALDDGKHESRSAAVATVCLAGGKELAEVVATHLDHVSEDTRMTQVRLLLEPECGGLKESHLPTVLLGDLNSLKQSDYSRADLREVADVRARSNWEPPRFEVTQFLARSGWRDCIVGSCDRHAVQRSTGLEDVDISRKGTSSSTPRGSHGARTGVARGRKSREKAQPSSTHEVDVPPPSKARKPEDAAVARLPSPPQEKSNSILVEAPARWRNSTVQGTCHYKTRIDYIWFRAGRETTVAVIPRSYHVYEPRRRTERNALAFTDHSCVTCALTFSSIWSGGKNEELSSARACSSA